jgi:hypothetical protein
MVADTVSSLSPLRLFRLLFVEFLVNEVVVGQIFLAALRDCLLFEYFDYRLPVLFHQCSILITLPDRIAVTREQVAASLNNTRFKKRALVYFRDLLKANREKRPTMYV